MATKDKSSWESRLEEQMKHVEKRIDEVAQKVEKQGEHFGKRVEAKVKEVEKEVEQRTDGSANFIWGAILIIIGLIWLGNNLGWFDYDIPWVPLALIGVGVYMILHRKDKEPKE